MYVINKFDDKNILDAIIIGDSWVDTSYNTHDTWPTLLCKKNKWNYLNVSCKGTIIKDCIEQVNSTEWIIEKEGVKINEDTLFIIHSGGNDILYNMYKNPFSLVFDFIQLPISSYIGCNIFDHRFSYFGNIIRNISQDMSSLLINIDKRYKPKRYFVSSLPVSYQLPICKYITNMICPCYQNKIVQIISDKMNNYLLDSLKAYSVLFFNEQSYFSHLSWKYDLYHPTFEGHSILSDKATECMQHKTYKNNTPSISKSELFFYYLSLSTCIYTSFIILKHIKKFYFYHL